MPHSPFTNLGSNQDPDDYHAQALDRRYEQEQLTNNQNVRIQKSLPRYRKGRSNPLDSNNPAQGASGPAKLRP